MRLRRVLPWLLLAASLPAALLLGRWREPAQEPSGVPDRAEPAGPRAPLSGSVVGPGGEAVAGAEVAAHAVFEGRASRLELVEADADGRFRFGALPVGTVALLGRGPGLAGLPQLVALGPGGLEDVALRLGAPGPLAGRVVDEDDGPVAGVRVCARLLAPLEVPELGGGCATTDREGAFALELPAPGPASLVATGEMVTPVERPDLLAPDDDLTIVVVRTSRLGGRVLRPDGSAGAGAVVSLAGSGIWPPRSAEADERGAFLFEDLPAGVYEVEARLDDLASRPELGVEVTAGREVAVDLELAQGVALTGAVVSGASGEPVGGATVSVSAGMLGAAPVVTRTGPEGEFSVRGLLAGPYWVTVWAEGHVAEVALPAEAPGALRVVLERGASVRGRVVDARGYPVSGALVEPDLPARSAPTMAAAIPADRGHWDDLGVIPGLELVEPGASAPPPEAEDTGRAVASTPRRGGDLAAPPPSPSAPPRAPARASWPVETGRDGTFEIGGLPAGRAIVLLGRHDSSDEGRSEPIVLAPGQVAEDVEIRLVAGVTVAGRVVDERGYPLSGALLSLLRGAAGGERSVAVSREDGGFELAPASGTVTLQAERAGSAPVSIELALGPGPGRTEVEVVLEVADRTLRGRVVDRRGFPIASAAVVARSATGASPIERRVQTGPDGTFEVEGLASGTATVEASAPGYSPAVVAAAPGQEELEVRLGLAGALAVEVVDGRTGERLADCSVEVLPASGSRRRGTCGGDEVVFDELPAGPAAVLARAAGRADHRIETVVEAGVSPSDPEAALRAELGPGGLVRGVVLDEAGEPVPGARVALSALPRLVVPAARGGWVSTGPDGRFELAGVSVEEGAVVHARRGRALGSAVVGALWPGEEPEVELTLEGDLSAAGRHQGLAVDLAGGTRVRLAAVSPGSRAEAAGLRAGDLLLAIDGRAPGSAAAAARALRGPRGSAVLLTLARGGDERTVLVEREAVSY